MHNSVIALFLSALFFGCGPIAGPGNADVALRCEAIVSNTTSGIVVRFKPVATLKGTITPDMVTSNGLLDYTEVFDSDVSVPKYYRVYLKKTEERTGPYKNAPLYLVYNLTLINDDER